ncbi:MAG: family 1 extracellular solute-binding protein [Paenibacillus sp.]|jgi:multiple sugar transport system substrate-binding protein|nr:family 1 extracellular solute-binding protein [Paenibacillus sp.]
MKRKMNRKVKTQMWLCVLLPAVAALTGCGAPAETPQPASEAEAVKEDTTPVTLKLYAGQNLTDENWNKLLHEPLKQKYPYITVEIVKPTAEMRIEQLVSTGNVPDLYTTFQGDIGNYIQLDLTEDMTPLVTKQKYDLSRFDRIYVDAIRAVSGNGGLYGIPYSVQFNALFYNKDIFDKFGAGYPQDGMTWEDAIELSRKVARTDGTIRYYGLDPESPTRLSFPLSIVPVDAASNRANVLTDGWRTVFETAKRVYEVQGNIPAKPAELTSGAPLRFPNNKNVAMLATINIFELMKKPTEAGMNWDVAQYPSYKGSPNTYGMVDLHMIGVTKTSKHKEAALKVIEVFASDEVQLLAAQTRPSLSPLVNPAMKEQFGAGLDYMKGKRQQSIFKSKPVPAPLFSPYDGKARAILNAQYIDFIVNNKDMNTALRMAQEEIDKMLQAEAQK